MKTYYMRLKSGSVIETEHPEHWPEAERMTAKAGKEALRQEAIDQLRELLPPGSTVYTILRHVSKSGMSRRIDCYTIIDNEPRYLSGYVSRLVGDRLHPGGGIVVGGCGMDMGFHIVHNLSYALHGMDNHDGEGYDKSGYTLRHVWI